MHEQYNEDVNYVIQSVLDSEKVHVRLDVDSYVALLKLIIKTEKPNADFIWICFKDIQNHSLNINKLTQAEPLTNDVLSDAAFGCTSIITTTLLLKAVLQNRMFSRFLLSLQWQAWIIILEKRSMRMIHRVLVYPDSLK